MKRASLTLPTAVVQAATFYVEDCFSASAKLQYRANLSTISQAWANMAIKSRSDAIRRTATLIHKHDDGYRFRPLNATVKQIRERHRRKFKDAPSEELNEEFSHFIVRTCEYLSPCTVKFLVADNWLPKRSIVNVTEEAFAFETASAAIQEPKDLEQARRIIEGLAMENSRLTSLTHRLRAKLEEYEVGRKAFKLRQADFGRARRRGRSK